jgi:hypothetical protein
MTVETLVTLLGVFVAVLAIMPRATRLELTLRMRARDIAALVLVFLIVHYLLFIDFFRSHGWIPHLRLSRLGLSPGVAAYFVVIGGLTLVGLDMWWFRLTRRKILPFRRVVEDLLWTEGFVQAFATVGRHLGQLERFATTQSWLSHLRERWQPRDAFDDFFPWSKGKRPAQPNRMKRWISGRLPERDEAREVAREVLRSLMTSTEAVEAVARQRPYLGLSFLRLRGPFVPVEEFVTFYFRALLSTPGSVWYAELRNNAGMSGWRYELPAENRLLRSILEDATVAENLNVYQPIGNFVEEELDRLSRLGRDDEYNHAMGDFKEHAMWRSPLWSTIFFFDVMVTEALWQDVEWHMWLYYYPAFVDRILRNSDLTIDPLVRTDAEWPTRYCFLLYEIISNLRGWVRALEHLPLGQRNVRLVRDDLENENGNIPKSAILALGQCLQSIVVAESLPEKFRRYLLDVAFELYFWLRSTPGFERYAHVLALSLRDGGSWLTTGNLDELRSFTIGALRSTDRGHFDDRHLRELLVLFDKI